MSRYGRDVIEVSTFRKAPAGNVKTNGNGVILRDNAYGTLDEDAFRRDFTVNALYYDPHEELILDYVGGIEDIKRRRLKFIGEARERLVEDPVRLLRAIRFQAKLGFALDAAITEDAAAITVRLQDIPSARLFDEFSKMFLTGYAANAWHLLERTPIAKALFPNTPAQDPLVPLAMLNTDRRIAIGRPVTAGFLLAVLLWGGLRRTGQGAVLNWRHGPTGSLPGGRLMRPCSRSAASSPCPVGTSASSPIFGACSGYWKSAGRGGWRSCCNTPSSVAALRLSPAAHRGRLVGRQPSGLVDSSAKGPGGLSSRNDRRPEAAGRAQERRQAPPSAPLNALLERRQHRGPTSLEPNAAGSSQGRSPPAIWWWRVPSARARPPWRKRLAGAFDRPLLLEPALDNPFLGPVLPKRRRQRHANPVGSSY